MAHYWRAALAQLVEQLSCKQQVIGSSPIGGSTEKRPRADESRRGAFCCARRYWRVGGFRSKAVDVLTLGRAGLVCRVLCCGRGRGVGLSGGLCCGRGRGWPVRGFGLCAGYWRVWRKAMSGCWGAVVRRGWVSRVWGFLLCAGGVGVCGGKRCRVAGAPWYVAGGDNGVLGLGEQ